MREAMDARADCQGACPRCAVKPGARPLVSPQAAADHPRIATTATPTLHGGIDALPGGCEAPPRPRNPLAAMAFGEYCAPRAWWSWLYNGAILYTACDEDSWSELWGLDIQPDDTVLSVTGSGCRTLNLLLDAPRRLVSVDSNPLQNMVLELKAAAIRRLDHAGFLEFLGVRPSEQRTAVYNRLRQDLHPATRSFWDQNASAIRAGILFSGAHERYYRKVLTPALGGLWRDTIARLFSFTDLAAQREFYESEWNGRVWRWGMRAVCRPWLFKMSLGDPSYFLHVELDQPVGDYLLDRFEHILTSRLARENHFLALLLLGRYHDEEAVPPYLHADHFETVKANLPALEIVTAPLDRFLATVPPAAFDKFSLSDISGWTSREEFAEILRAVVRCSRPGARLCYRNFLTKRGLPADLSPTTVPRPDIAEALTNRDLAFVCTFEVADVREQPSRNGRVHV
jgi:S-adenosylmethionine-diacylglycerol 3-amino-3-carboxypropyl transferase